jgi:hypothetical protein
MNRNSLFYASSILILILLASCREKQANISGNEFSIYLLAGEVSPEKIDLTKPLELAVNPLISVKDMVNYDKATHEIQLTESGYEIMHNLTVPTQGKAFAVCVNGEIIYTGAFWAPYSSQSFGGIVIDPFQATKENPIIQITLGYPGQTFFEGEDSRADARIMQALEKIGKLK